MKRPKITVITTTYNSERFVSEAINSILSQTYKDFEYIIVDDCSSDNTVRIIQEFQKRDHRIKLIKNKENSGTYASANNALKIAKGKYVARIDSDDVALPDRLETQVHFLEKNSNIKLVGSWVLLINDIGAITNAAERPVEFSEILSQTFFTNVIVHSSIMFNYDFVKNLGFYDQSERKSQDYELYLKIIKAGGELYNIPRYLVYYRQHSDNITTNHKLEQLKIMEGIIIKYLKEILSINVSESIIRTIRKIYIGNLDGLKRKDKLQVVNFMIQYLAKYRFKYHHIENSYYQTKKNVVSLLSKFIFNKHIFKIVYYYLNIRVTMFRIN